MWDLITSGNLALWNYPSPTNLWRGLWNSFFTVTQSTGIFVTNKICLKQTNKLHTGNTSYKKTMNLPDLSIMPVALANHSASFRIHYRSRARSHKQTEFATRVRHSVHVVAVQAREICVGFQAAKSKQVERCAWGICSMEERCPERLSLLEVKLIPVLTPKRCIKVCFCACGVR